MNYLLIDYENVQPRSLAPLEKHSFRVIVFIGAQQRKIAAEFVTSLPTSTEEVRFVQMAGNGRNALDFHIAFTLGELLHADPEGTFHVISNDSGFDPLIRYLRGKGSKVYRWKEIGAIPLLRKVDAQSTDEIFHAVVRNLTSRSNGRPRRVAGLKNTINSLFANSLQDPDLAGIVAALAEHGHITIDGENVIYPAPEAI